MTTEPEAARPFWRRPVFFIPAGLLVLFGLGSLASGGETDLTTTTALSSTTEATAPPSTTTTTTTTTTEPTTTSSSTTTSSAATTQPTTTTTTKATTTISKATTTTSKPTTTTSVAQNCDPYYPDFCIPPPPPDLDCGDIAQKNFTVLQPDPHGFDGDNDGIGCET